jgi:hypothetical protein
MKITQEVALVSLREQGPTRRAAKIDLLPPEHCAHFRTACSACIGDWLSDYSILLPIDLSQVQMAPADFN